FDMPITLAVFLVVLSRWLGLHTLSSPTSAMRSGSIWSAGVRDIGLLMSAAPRAEADGDRALPENTWVVCASPHDRPSALSIAASPTKQLVLRALRTSEKPMSAAEVSATIGISNDATLAAVALEGHQFHRPIIAAMAGTVMVRTTKVSINRPMPMMNPVCTIADRLPNSRPN